MKKQLITCLLVLSALLLFPSHIFASETEQPADPGVVIEILSTPQSFDMSPLAASKGEYVNIKVKFTGTPPATYFYTRGAKSGTLKRYQSVDKNTALYDGYIK